MKKTVIGLILTQGIIMCFTLFVINGHRVNENYELNDVIGLSNDYELYVNKSKSLMKTSLLEVFETDDYLLLTRDDNSSIIGIYDPTQYLAQYRLDVSFGFSRGISFLDYKNQKRVGIKVVEQNYLGCALAADARLENIAFCIDPYSNLYEKGIEYYVNVFSTEHFGKYVYLDLSKKDITRVRAVFIDNGYQIVEKKDIGLTKAYLTVFSGKYTVSSLGVLAIAMQGIYLFTVMFYFISRKTETKIHYYHGGNALSIFYKKYALTLLCTVVLNALLLALIHQFYKDNTLAFMTVLDYGLTLVYQLVIVMIIWVNGYLITYYKMRKEVAKDAKKH